jgi:hypothetical protein
MSRVSVLCKYIKNTALQLNKSCSACIYVLTPVYFTIIRVVSTEAPEVFLITYSPEGRLCLCIVTV